MVVERFGDLTIYKEEIMLSKILKNHIKVENSKHRPKQFHASVNKIFQTYVDRVNHGHGWEDIDSCPVCNSNETSFEFEKFNIEMVRCLKCNLRYHTKFPVNIDDVYNDENYKKNSAGYLIKNEYEYRKNRFGLERVKLLEDHLGPIKNKLLLDVGCGSGYFLECAAEYGANCHGLEPSNDVRNDALNRLDIPISGLPIENYESKNKYDIITCFDVIEHVKNPIGMLNEINRLLKMNGNLLLYTPNFESFGVKVTKKDSNLVAPGSHLMLFTYDSIKSALSQTGFKLDYYKTFGLDIDDIISVEESRNTQNKFLNDWKEELQAIIDYSNCGTYMRVIAKKINTNS